MEIEIERFVNLTPHTVRLLNQQEQVQWVLPPCERPARATPHRQTVTAVSGVQILGRESEPRTVRNLPEPEQGTVYIVSRMVRDALYQLGQERPDVMVPTLYTYDSSGAIYGCRGLGY